MDFSQAVAKTELAKYRVLAPRCGLRVSPLQLGAMSLGNAWGQGMGAMTKEQAFELLDAFVAEGGNFIDTANNYQVLRRAPPLPPFSVAPGTSEAANTSMPAKRTSRARLGLASGWPPARTATR
jgi:hypothetical protein